MEKEVMKEILLEIPKALDAEAYLPALAMALTLPDTCGKAECPELPSKNRYINWYKKYVEESEKNDNPSFNTFLSAKVVYSLRNALLHQGTPGTKNNYCLFNLFFEKSRRIQIYADISKDDISKNEKKEKKEYCVNVQRLCFILTSVAEKYYEENKDAFSFMNECKIIQNNG